jgi:hypothetical protein
MPKRLENDIKWLLKRIYRLAPTHENNIFMIPKPTLAKRGALEKS